MTKKPIEGKPYDQETDRYTAHFEPTPPAPPARPALPAARQFAAPTYNHESSAGVQMGLQASEPGNIDHPISK